MSLNQLKNPLTCFIGSIVLMSLIYSVFFGVGEIKEAFAVMIGFISVISWKPIYFVFGSTVLFLQCMIYNNAKGRYKLFLVIALSFVLLFSILCLVANSDAFSWRAVIYSVFLLIISQLVVMWKNTAKDSTEDKFFCGVFIFGCVVGLAFTLFGEPKPSSSEKEQIAEHIEKQDKIEKKAKENSLTQLKDVEEKYKKEFTSLGFTNVHLTKDSHNNNAYKYIMADYSIQKSQLLADNWDTNKVIDNSLSGKIDFENIHLKLENDKFTITGLVYDKKLISQQQLAINLDLVMDKLIMPELREVKKEIDRQKKNIASHKKE